ncbi:MULTISPECIES: phosphatase PAP2 family protein [Asticcacaulis]|uniref:phosphatase PAP2 family protein n=1 Tax=Asticcacaulis TaxID=76890 RepID=UPI001FD8B9B1|nr:MULTISPECIES: phosphatase PAP2 family protein [Asticcacaulis]MBP2160426.1 undecaprenyl-diphosphatase [Asticcacaulis solisilvae]MDR6801471.1 undecaprenyl-diphosphatase [Asticcacaulis sp. BE141]
MNAATLTLVMLLAAILIGVCGVIFLLRLTLFRLIPFIARRSVAAHGWLEGRSPWLSKRLNGWFDPFRQEWQTLLVLAILFAGTVGLFLAIVEDLIEGDPLFLPDKAVYGFLQSLRSVEADRVLIAITEMGDSIVVLTVACAIAAGLAWRRAWRTLLYWLMAVAGGSAINSLLKTALQRQRPADIYEAGVDLFSFPSGHSTTNAILYGCLAMIIVRQAPFTWRTPLACGAACLVVLMAFSRVYLGAHWLSDVVGGLAFAAIWLAVLGFFYLRRPAEPLEPKLLIGIAAATLLLAASINITLHHSAEVELYKPRQVMNVNGYPMTK